MQTKLSWQWVDQFLLLKKRNSVSLYESLTLECELIYHDRELVLGLGK